jgi:hypothetical protein
VGGGGVNDTLADTPDDIPAPEADEEEAEETEGEVVEEDAEEDV